MNIYLIVISIILVGEYLIGVVTERLNLQRLSPEVLESFKGYYDEDLNLHLIIDQVIFFQFWPHTYF